MAQAESLVHWWVTVIDDKGQSNPGLHDCSPTCIVLNRGKLTLDYRFDCYMYGQFMKFIRPGDHKLRITIQAPHCTLAHDSPTA
jgi:hypothetical protein